MDAEDEAVIERRKSDPNWIGGVKWYEAIEPCRCEDRAPLGVTVQVWRTYTETGHQKRYMVRCPACGREMQASTRSKAIRLWNDSTTSEEN